jgi:integrase
MKDRLITEIQASMAPLLSSDQMKELRRVLTYSFHNVVVTERKNISTHGTIENKMLLGVFIAAKRIEGCSEKSLKYYDATVCQMLSQVNKPVREVNTDDLRGYLAGYQKERNSSKVTIDNMRRIFSSFFAWMEDEDYIFKSPVRRIFFSSKPLPSSVSWR